MSQTAVVHPRYKVAGVDTNEADVGLKGLIGHVMKTWPHVVGFRNVLLEIGYFANVVDFGGIGVALCTDGVGSKALVAHRLRKYDTIGIDCVAMNVNDLICVGAVPVSMVDYIAVETADSWMLEQIGKGLAEGSKQGRVSLSGGEISQIRDMVRGFDLVGMAIGKVPLDRIIEGQDLRAGDVVIGLESSGVHSNGLSMARRAFFESHSFSYEHKFSDLGRTIGEELLEPTIIYVPEVLDILTEVPEVRALVNITSDGFLNLARVKARVGFRLTDLPAPQPIFGLIQRYGGVSDAEMHEVYNMGIGFCVVVAPASADATLGVLKAHGRKANVIGHVVDDPEKRVSIPGRRLVGQRKTFTEQR